MFRILHSVHNKYGFHSALELASDNNIRIVLYKR